MREDHLQGTSAEMMVLISPFSDVITGSVIRRDVFLTPSENVVTVARRSQPPSSTFTFEIFLERENVC